MAIMLTVLHHRIWQCELSQLPPDSPALLSGARDPVADGLLRAVSGKVQPFTDAASNVNSMAWLGQL